jgi:hypothetical protein
MHTEGRAPRQTSDPGADPEERGTMFPALEARLRSLAWPLPNATVRDRTLREVLRRVGEHA